MTYNVFSGTLNAAQLIQLHHLYNASHHYNYIRKISLCCDTKTWLFSAIAGLVTGRASSL